MVERLGCERQLADECLFIREMIWILTYADNIIIAANDKARISSTKNALSKSFDAIEFGKLHQFLGIEFGRDSDIASLNQVHIFGKS